MPLNIYPKHLRTYGFALCLSISVLLGCKPLSVIHTESKGINTGEEKVVDEEMVLMIAPYKIQLDDAMEIVLANMDTELIAEQPESTMGNHVAEITYWKAKQYTEKPIDFAISNFGGMRIPFLDKGPLKVKDAYQIMPFDNYVVLMTVPAATVQILADKMAEAKGWPVHQMSYQIKEGKAVDLKVNGQPLDLSKEYTFALTDYLATGGDNLAFLKSFEYINTNEYLRDAIIEFWKHETSLGKIIHVVKDGRVKLADE
jgi:2',3'-cyclic-nucleotide 2'-phosphodiesterase (5'-nucleotidase family)